MLPQDRASWIPKEVDAAGHRLAELSEIPSKGEQPVESYTKENLEEISEHSFSSSDDVGLPSRFCTVQAREGRLVLRYVEGQSRLSKPSDHYI